MTDEPFGTDDPADDAAAVARFGPGPAWFSPDVPAPRRPHVGPLPRCRPDTSPDTAGSPHRPATSPETGGLPHRPAATSTAALVRAPRHLPDRRAPAPHPAVARVEALARRAAELAARWTGRGALSVVAAVDTVTTAVEHTVRAVVTALLGREPAPGPGRPVRTDRPR